MLDTGKPKWREDERPRLSQRPVLQIGTAGGGQGTVLHDVVDAIRLEDGAVVVANAGSSEIRFFGPAGEFLYSVGQGGDGPGDFQRLMALGYIEQDRMLLAFDHWTARVTEYGRDGNFVRTFAPATAEGGRASDRARRLIPLGWLRSGTLVARREIRDPAATAPRGDGESLLTSRGTVYLGFFDRDGRPTAGVDGLPGDERVARVGVSGTQVFLSSVPVPFLKTFEGAAAADRVVVGNTERLDLRVYDASGDLVLIIRRPGPPREVGAGDRQAWIDGQLSGVSDPVIRNRQRRQYERMDFPSTMPSFRSVDLDDDGQIWVEEFDPAASPSDESRWSVYDGRGQRLGQIAMPPRFRPLEIGRNYVLGVWKDGLGIEYVRLYRLAAPEGAAAETPSTPEADG
ncbi:MAG: hypothetical protein F4020_07910 [Gammaproteobacteria bacterium]|nr:hypothetical protein [Gammaproteobacteria bacterium]